MDGGRWNGLLENLSVLVCWDHEHRNIMIFELLTTKIANCQARIRLLSIECLGVNVVSEKMKDSFNGGKNIV